eukprot:TRINITY_DN10918_c0_g1_i1.p1 TRINITY_DN10918_c0_g1~~TRINITY_DN10918_c0_g1_i1.p1  ORF type:complete len:191 (-),score=76.68 TRINITY_DN10918_c0_g1_i1:31-603(-)
MVKVKPIQTKGKVNFKTLVAELKAHLEAQERQIDLNNSKIEALRRQQNKTTLAVESARNPATFGTKGGVDGGKGDKVAKTRKVLVRREIVNDDGEIEIIEEYVDETYYESRNKGGAQDEYKAAQDADAADAVLMVLDDETEELLANMSDELKQLVASQKLQSDKHGIQALMTITQEENEEAMKFSVVTIR